MYWYINGDCYRSLPTVQPSDEAMPFGLPQYLGEAADMSKRRLQLVTEISV